jgi:hypothetical protein
LTVNSSAGIAGGLGVSGTFNAYGAFIATGSTTLNNTLGVLSTTTVSGTLNARNALNVLGGLNVSGTTALSNALTVSGTTTLNNTFTVNSSAGIAGGMNVSGVVNAYGSMNVQNLTVSGAFTIGSLSIPTLTVSGSTTTGSLGCVGALTVSGSTTLNNALGVKGTTNLGVLNVSGLLTNTGGFTATNPGNSTSLTISPGNAGGNATSGYIQYDVVGTTGTHFFWDNMQVTGSLRADGALYANAGLTVSGGMTLYNNGTLLSIVPGYAGGNASSGYVQYNIPGNNTHYFWNDMQVTGKLTVPAVQNSYGTFSVTRTGSDTNVLTIGIPNYTTTQRTTVDINYSHASSLGNVYQGYFGINTGDTMIAILWGVKYAYSSGFVVQDNGTPAYAHFATDVLEDTDVHLRLEIYKRRSKRCIMEVSCEYCYGLSGTAAVLTKIVGNMTTQTTNIDISSVFLRTSTTTGKAVAGSYTLTQRGVP